MLMSGQKEIDIIHDKIISILKQERLRQNLSQEKLAELSGLSRRGIGMIESNQIKPTFYKVLRVAAALDINLSIELDKL